MRIGELAAATETNVQTLRFYEKRGLLGKSKRLLSGYRDFTPETVRIVRYIKQSQELGFTLNEIKELFRLREKISGNSAEVRAIAFGKLASVESKIEKLKQIRGELKHILETCECSGKIRCPALEALDHHTVT
ncbi:MAG: heavy metal-responsive transcriptional regulator [Acidobacteriota bacterium]|nr:heavy metal-responsive transcriptional regulator [Acidobacteriota bacterium]